MSKRPIGATITYSFPTDNGWELVGYVSFGEYDEDKDCDTYGIDDEHIFFYSSLEELTVIAKQTHTGQPRSVEWMLLSIDDLHYGKE